MLTVRELKFSTEAFGLSCFILSSDSDVGTVLGMLLVCFVTWMLGCWLLTDGALR